MPTSPFDSFRAELATVQQILFNLPGKTLRDEDVRARIRLLYRMWAGEIEPSLRSRLASQRDSLKLRKELENLAVLSSKQKPLIHYARRFKNALTLIDRLAVFLPPTGTTLETPRTGRDQLFLPEIPDLPDCMVPNSIYGWQDKMKLFLMKYPFDKSVFIMVRYRKRNDALIKAVKDSLRRVDLVGILASEHNITDDLYNPVACLLCCSKGIAVFDKGETDQEFSPNVSYEVGMVHLLGRRCLHLKHRSLRVLPSDFLAKLYTEYSTIPDATEKTVQWANSDAL